MMFQAVLSNPDHPDYGVATIPFPIPSGQYAHCIELLEALEIGSALQADCLLDEIRGPISVLKTMELLRVNVDELNYLAKRLDSFDIYEAAQFQAMAHKLEICDPRDLINLTFCCQQATVITSFSDLTAIGRDHYMNLHGGSARVDELEALDGEETARLLIEGGGGMVTPYGVVYDNGMELEPIYDGQYFPCYFYAPNPITISVTSKAEPKDTKRIAWLYFPMEQKEIDRILLRAGIAKPSELRLHLESSQLPDEVNVRLNMERENITDLNELAQAVEGLSEAEFQKLGAAAVLADPKSAIQVKYLAEHLDLFVFASPQHAPEPWRDENRDEILRMKLRVDGKPDYTLVLPADEEYLDAVKAYLDIDVFADAMLCDIRFKVPYIGEMICDTDCPAVEDYNDFAERLETIWQKDGMMLTYAAVLDAERPDTLHRCCELLQDLDNYQRIFEGTYEYGQQRFQEIFGLNDEAIYELDDYMDFEKYGSDCMDRDHVIETDFGLLRRLDPPFPEQGPTQEQRM